MNMIRKTLPLLAALPVLAQAEGISVTRQDEMSFQQAPASNFTGSADFARYPVMPSSGDVGPALVRFQPGARTNWHAHPHGQYLIITDGVGWVQEWGKPVQTVKKGDTVWFAPNVKHWHGATDTTPMSHVAISIVDKAQPGVTWMEAVEQVDVAKAQPTLVHQDAKPLSPAQLDLFAIAALAARGDMERLDAALKQGLKDGLSVVQIKESLSHLYAYIGAPRTLNAMTAFKKIVDERGIDQPLEVVPDNGGYYQQGVETLAELTQASTKRPIFDFAPALDYSLKSHLFGYLFSRHDLLSAVNRELTTLGALNGLGGVNGQLRSHFGVVKNLGFKASHFDQLIEALSRTLGKAEAENARKILTELP